MARGDSYNALQDIFGSDDTFNVEADDLGVAQEETKVKEDTDKKKKDTVKPVKEEKKEQKKEETKPAKENKDVEEAEKSDTNFSLNFNKVKKRKTVPRLFKMNPYVNDVLDEIIYDSNGKQVSGSKGFLSTLANNAIIKELIELEVVDKSFEKYLKDY